MALLSIDENMKNAAQVHKLSVAFRHVFKPLVAVDSISFDLRTGETLALLGESGCGKSLTALALMRLLPKNAVYGAHSHIALDRQDVLNISEKSMRSLRGLEIAIIFQDPMSALNPVLTIEAQMKEALKGWRKLSHQALKKRLIAMLEEVEIPNPEIRLKQYPHQLSGGQKQRIVIAMALMNRPHVLIADEPTTALDVTIQAQILALLKKIQQAQAMSIILITHDLSVVKAAADRVCVMYASEIVEEAPVGAFFQDPKHPYSQQLMASVPSYQKRGRPLAAIKGSVPSLESLPSGCRFHTRCAHAFARCSEDHPELHYLPEGPVRCHLYPEHKSLPPLIWNDRIWLAPIGEEAQPLLSVEGLKIHFKVGAWYSKEKKTIKAVDGVSFQLEKGRTLALVGESGCGKTTASRTIIGLIQKTAGHMSYRGTEIASLRGVALKAFRSKVQIIFQDPYTSMNPRLSVGEILAEGMIAQGLKGKDIQALQFQLLDQVNLPKNSLNRYPYQFSGGQRQRICIARALAVKPEILICDEPTSALDLSVQAQILNLLKELQIETGMAYLFITHNMAAVAYLADTIMVMKNGKIVESGSVEQILQKPTDAYTQQLIQSGSLQFKLKL